MQKLQRIVCGRKGKLVLKGMVWVTGLLHKWATIFSVMWAIW